MVSERSDARERRPSAHPPPRRASSEAARLAAVRAVGLDPGLAIECDRIAAAAAHSCSVEAAGVSLVGAAVRYLGARSLPITSMPRAGSFCGDVVACGAPLLVADAAAMPDFSDHPMVRDCLMRAYAGVPVVDRDGHALGAVCVFSPEPGRFAETAFDDLSALAAYVEEKLSALDRRPAAPSQAWLGVKTSRAWRDDAQRPGLIVLRVAKHSPAEAAGLRPADLLHSVDEHVLYRPIDLMAALAGLDPGSAAVVRYHRRGRVMTCRAVLGTER